MTLVYLNVNEHYFDNYPFVKLDGANQYERARFKGEGLTLILYMSGKLVIQGSDALLDNFKKNHSNLNLKESKEKKQLLVLNIPDKDEYIGSDETLKGDTFGGLVVVGACFKKEDEEKLKRMGVVDSKQLTDFQIINIAENLLEYYLESFVVKELTPKEYNQIVPSTPLTQVLNHMHNEVGLELKKEHSKAFHIVDKYPGCNAGDLMIEKGESHSIAVAAASIVARKIGLDQFDILSKRAGFVLPKGSTHVKDALKLLKELNLPLEEFAKMHFKNVY